MNERIEFEISIGRLKAANLFTSTDPTRHAMAGVRVEVRHSGEVMLAATDGHRLACVKGQGAIEILRASVRAKLLATDDPHGRKVASNTLISLDWIEEYLGLEKAEGGAE